MIKANYTVNASPQFRILTDKQLEAIHMATLELLQRTGVDVHNEQACKILKDAGCLVQGSRVRFPSDIVTKCINSAPERVSVYNRNGQPAMFLEEHKVYYGTGSDTPYLLDPYTGKRRKTVNDDIAKANRIADYLENIDFCMSLGIASDYPQPIVDIVQLLTQIKNTTKPIVFVVQDTENLKYCIDMAETVAGGEDNLRLKPFILHYSEPLSPLAHPGDSIERLMICAKKGVPLVYAPGVQAGATGPVTIAGAMVCGNAEILSGLVIHQLVRPGAPIIHGGNFTIMDMKTANYSLGGSPEWYLANAAMKELSYYYKLPYFGTAGCTDSKVFDQQAALEVGQNILIQALSGANLVHDIGYMECGLTASWELIVASDEIIGLTKRFMKGIRVDDEALALDVLDKVGPGGHFLGEEHTLRLFKEEHWIPKLLDRNYYNIWKNKGSLTMGEKACEVVKQILEEHEVAELPIKIEEELNFILDKAKNERLKNTEPKRA